MDNAEIEAELRDALARLLRDRCDIEAVRAVTERDPGWDRELWSELVAMGVPGLATSAEHGGQDAGFGLLVVALEEIGRRLAPVPLMSSVVAQAALAACAPVASGLLEAVAATERTAAVVVDLGVDGWQVAAGVTASGPGASGCGASASGTSDPWTLTGSAAVVAEAGAADVLLVAATTDEGPALFAVEVAAAAAGQVAVFGLVPLDPTRPLAKVTFEAASARLLAGSGEFADVLRALRRVALLELAAESVGVAAEATDLAISYAKIRVQFGRPIGVYQAISHRSADMFVGVQAARALVLAAASALDAAAAVSGSVGGADEELDLAVSLAAAEAFDAAVAAAGGCLQIHGGIGFTWDHPTHSYLRRAKANEALVAAPDRLREQAAHRLVSTAKASNAARAAKTPARA